MVVGSLCSPIFCPLLLLSMISLDLTKEEFKLTYWALIGYKDHPWGEDQIDALESLIEKLGNVEN